MAHDPIADRYAHALFEAAKEANQIDETLEQLSLIAQILREHPDAQQLMINPDVEAEEKVQIFNRVFHGSWSELLRAFVHVVAAFGRAEFLEAIAATFADIIDEDQHRLRAVVRSAHPLPEPMVERLRHRLEVVEHKQIILSTAIDPELLGGLQIVLDHRIIDSSVKRHLAELRQQLKSVRVH